MSGTCSGARVLLTRKQAQLWEIFHWPPSLMNSTSSASWDSAFGRVKFTVASTELAV